MGSLDAYARSDKFLAINLRCDSAIYIYDPKGEKCLVKYEIEGNICQLAIEGDLLFVVEQHLDGSRNLVVFKLENLDQQDPIIINLPKNEKLWPSPSSICFGKEYLIYTQNLFEGNQIHALPLSCLQNSLIEETTLPWINGSVTNNRRYLFPKDNHFIEICFNECYICDIYKVEITSNGFVKTEIAKEVVISKDESAFRTDVCLYNNRVIFAYESFIGCNGTKIFSYDIISGKASELLVIPHSASNFPFKPRFLNVATNIYYLNYGIKFYKRNKYGFNAG